MVRSCSLSRAIVMGVAMMILPCQSLAESARSLVAKGNRSFSKNSFQQALDYYERASVKSPESEIVEFNKGAALYKQGDYARAREHFRAAASKTRSMQLEAKAWYNLGNVSFKEAQRQEDSDLRQALSSLEESVRNYITALEKDPSLREAAENLEIARLKIKDLLDKIKKQEEQGGKSSRKEQDSNESQNMGQNQQQSSGEESQQQSEGAQQDQQDGREEEKREPQSSGAKEKEKQLAPDQTAREIIDEERQNRKQRQREEGRARYRPVEKDW